MSEKKNYIDEKGNYHNIENLTLAQIYASGVQEGYRIANKADDKYICMKSDKLRLMYVEECAGHTIDYAMGWKACIEWIKSGRYMQEKTDDSVSGNNSSES